MAARSKRAAILFRKWRFARPRAFGRLTGPAPPRGTSRRPPTSRLPRAGVKEAPQQKLRPVVIAHHEHPVQAGQADEIGRAHVGTPVTNAQLVFLLLIEKKKKQTKQ